MAKRIGLIAVLLGLWLCPALLAGATSFRAPFAFSFFDSCNNELVNVSGTFHLVMSTSGDKTRIRLNAKGTGEGASSGRKYEWIDTIHQDVDDPDGDEFTVEVTQTLRLVSHGKDQNLVLDFEFSIETDADNNTTITIVSVTNCRGADA